MQFVHSNNSSSRQCVCVSFLHPCSWVCMLSRVLLSASPSRVQLTGDCNCPLVDSMCRTCPGCLWCSASCLTTGTPSPSRLNAHVMCVFRPCDGGEVFNPMLAALLSTVPSSNRAIGLTVDQYRYIISSCCFVDCSLAEFDLRLVLNAFLMLFLLSELGAADCH